MYIHLITYIHVCMHIYVYMDTCNLGAYIIRVFGMLLSNMEFVYANVRIHKNMKSLQRIEKLISLQISPQFHSGFPIYFTLYHSWTAAYYDFFHIFFKPHRIIVQKGYQDTLSSECPFAWPLSLHVIR